MILDKIRDSLELKQVSKNCYAVTNKDNLVCDSNSGLINIGKGAIIDTQSDINHAKQMFNLFSTKWKSTPEYIINTHEDIDHVLGNELFKGCEIIAHSSVPDRMKHAADPQPLQELLHNVSVQEAFKDGISCVGRQLLKNYNFDDAEVVYPTMVFDDKYIIDLDGTEVHLIYVGPAHQMGDIIVHVPKEGVIFAGDILFRLSTPIGWIGTFDNWFKALDLITKLNPEVIVPGHGPICGIEVVKETELYFKYVLEESKICFDRGLSSLEAAINIELGPYEKWKGASRIFMNVERAYREFRGVPHDTPWDTSEVFNGVYKVAMAKKLPLEF